MRKTQTNRRQYEPFIRFCARLAMTLLYCGKHCGK